MARGNPKFKEDDGYFVQLIKQRNPHGSPKNLYSSMGWPYIGETLQLYSQDLRTSTLLSRYGEIFKTHLLGCPCVMLASPEASRFVLMTQAYMFKPTYPKSKENLIGPSALFFHQGVYHARLRKLVQSSLSPQAIRNLVSGIEAVAVPALIHGPDLISSAHLLK